MWVLDGERVLMSHLLWKNVIRFCVSSSVMLALLGSGIVHGEVVINEFVASNREGLQDEDGAYPDWIELYNSGDTAVPLLGWSLTDDPGDPDRWTFPDITLGVGEYLVVFASAKDRRPTNGDNLHTNFELNVSGEYLALCDASDVPQVPSVFDPQYPTQVADVSHGLYAGGSGYWYFDMPTPGTANEGGNVYSAYAGTPEFSRSGGTFTDPFSLELVAEAPGAVIHYTLDGSLPTGTSSVYTNPIAISTTTQVRAHASGPGLLPSPVVGEVYLALDSGIEEFESNLPLAVIDSLGFNIDSEDGGDRPFRPVLSVFIDTDEGTGRAAITDEADYAGYGAMHVRGESTAGYQKKQYRFETRDEFGEDKDVPLLGFPSEADWILHGPFSDKTLMRNYMVYDSWWRGRMGRIGVRTRLVEMFLDREGDGTVSIEDYVGVYVLMEKVERGASRVDIARLEPDHNSEPEITGGYIFRHDWQGDPGFTTDIYNDYLVYEEPEWDEITPAQEEWIKAYCDEFEAALSGSNFTDPDEGYAKYVDVGSFIDNQIMVEIGRNVDGYVLSTFFYKDRGGKITMGPVWDYNGSLGGADYFCACQTDGWHYEFDETNCPECREGGATFPADNYDSFHWWERMMEDPEYLLQFADRWFDLREEAFATASLMQEIDDNAALLTDNGALDSAVTRNFTLSRWLEDVPDNDLLSYNAWPNYYDNTHHDAEYMDYVNWMKDWITDRLDWMDWEIAGEFGAAPPVFYVNGGRQDAGGHIQSGDVLAIEAPAGVSGTVYYTLDGSDPRVPGTPPEVAGTAIQYTDPITLTDTTHIKARILDGTSWSALNKATFYVRDLSDALRVTEIMYHPAGGSAEFIELQNVGGNAEDISGVYFSDGIQFAFPAGTIVQPGEYIVLVSSRDEPSFVSQYPGVAIGGLYKLKLDNGGEAIAVNNANDDVLISFTYDDDAPWPTQPDGLGFSLVRVNLEGDPNDPASWRASTEAGGSPGQGDENIPVTAAFTAHPTSGNRTLTVEFTDQSTGTISGWSWDFGDGGTSAAQNPSHAYRSVGSFTVSLTVSGPGGSDVETKTDYIQVTERPQVAAFTADPTSGDRPLTVQFTDVSSGSIASWSWDFGDGYESSVQNPLHTYYFAGDHTVTLTVSGPSGSDTETTVIHVDQGSSDAERYKVIVDDIKVTYSRGGCLAWYNDLDGTLRVEVWEDGGTLNVICREEAAMYWDSRCDVYIYAPDASIKKMNLKGRPETQLFVCGQVGYVKNFKLKHGFVGDTAFYGPEVGLGSAALDPPKKILIKSGWSTAAVLGIGYPELRFDPEGAENEVGSVELKPKPFEILLDEDDDDPDGVAVAGAEASVEAKAAYIFEQGDLKVIYSKPGCVAYYDAVDGILRIAISESDGDLTVKCGEEAYLEWEDYCDIYIDAPTASINVMNLKGRPETQLHVAGEVASVNKFKLKYGSVGGTDYYGPEVGLANTSLELPNKIKILWGWTTAPVLGVSY